MSVQLSSHFPPVDAHTFYWDVMTLSWVPGTQPGGGPGGTVDQGTGGLSPWLVTGPLTDTELRASPVPISAASLPLPTGAATLVAQNTGNASLSSIDGKLTSPLTVQATDLDIRNLTFATDKVDASGSAVTVSSSALPSNAAQETGGNLTTIAANTTSLAAEDFATETTLAELTITPGMSATSATGPLVQGMVSDARESYLDVTVRPLSLTSDGRLRVATSPSPSYLEFFEGPFPFDVPDLTNPDSPWDISSSPWG